MKKALKVIIINIEILVVLLVLLEVVLRLIGMNTIQQLERKNDRNELRTQTFCKRIATQKFKTYNQFFTDSDGIFKANPEFFRNSKVKIFINPDGFRGVPFANVDTPRKKVFLIGDSFTWGSTAKPLTRCFANLLEEAGYYVYNGGIPGTDPQQYALITEKYTARLKPDVVVVCVYMGNDVSGRSSLIQPNKNLHFITNFGFLKGYDDNGYFFKDANEAFLYVKKRKCGCCMGLWDYFVLKTVIGGRLYHLFKKPIPRISNGKKWVTVVLQRIQDTCNRNGTKCIILLIPQKNQDTQPSVSIKTNRHLFKDFLYYYPENLQKSDYCEAPDNHFNNQGHRKFADFIIEKLELNGFPRELKQ